MQERRFLFSNVYERGLNAGEDSLHPAEEDVTYQPTLVGPVEHELSEPAVFLECDPGLFA